jgi:putative SOS response-associated peptidase YedK
VCNLYGTTDAQHLRTLLFAKNVPADGWDMTVAPLKTGVFIRQHGEALIGQWGMIPPNASDRVPRNKTTGRPLSTNNARRETVATAWTFRFPWARGQASETICRISTISVALWWRPRPKQLRQGK